MAGVPEGGLRVLMVPNGSMLDSETLGKIGEIATENNFQLLVEQVDDSVPKGHIEITADYEIEVQHAS